MFGFLVSWENRHHTPKLNSPSNDARRLQRPATLLHFARIGAAALGVVGHPNPRMREHRFGAEPPRCLLHQQLGDQVLGLGADALPFAIGEIVPTCGMEYRTG